MAFVKERIPEADKDLFNSFDVYDYDNGEDSIFTKWHSSRDWVVDRDEEIYFFYVFGGHHLEQHPYQQYDLVWKSKKVIVFLEMWGQRNSQNKGESCSHYTYNIVRIYAPNEFKPLQQKMIELIKKAITVDHSIDILNSGVYYSKDTMKITSIPTPEYFDEVR